MLLGVIFLSLVSTLKERSTIRHGLCNLFSHKRVINLPVREPIKLPCNPRAYLSSHSMWLVPWLLSHSFRQLIHLNTVCSPLSALALHYWLHRSLPLFLFFSPPRAALPSADLLSAACSQPSISLLVTYHTRSQLNLELPKDLTLTIIIQLLFYIRSSKENQLTGRTLIRMNILHFSFNFIKPIKRSRQRLNQEKNLCQTKI